MKNIFQDRVKSICVSAHTTDYCDNNR